MPDHRFFTSFGFFAVPQFLDAPLCGQIRDELRRAETVPATVHEEEGRYAVDERRRSTDWAQIAPATESAVEQRLLGVMPEVARHFDLQLEGIQSLQFLVYGEGDYFKPHRDRNESAGGAAFSRRRRVSAVLFLNDQRPEPAPDCYGGGELTFYGLLDDERADSLGFPLQAETGLLVAFPPDVVHEVTPVTHGERHTVVTWFE